MYITIKDKDVFENFYEWGGFKPFATKEMDFRIGQLLKLPYEI